LEAFGDVAMVLPTNAVKGKVSPFDTGGLVNKIDPINGLTEGEKRTFLNAFTWPISKMPSLLQVHPTDKKAQVLKYLDGISPPSAAGPSVLWPNAKATSAIWNAKNDWRAWTWEVRSPEQVDASKLEQWSCSTTLYTDILDYVDSLGHSASWFGDIAARYVHGGVSDLVVQWKARQAA